MPSKRQYDLVHNDDNDPRVPLHSDEAFHHGISFNAKYIGTLDVPRPTSRVEIVAAMRRIRYEFKAKGIKKKKVTLEVSVDGVRVNLRKKKKKNQWMDENKLLVMQHPIYRIFYVSHDSQDLKIFSFIARDGASNVFKCNVFKSSKKSQAMKVVRTVGQAFEVCHKLAANSPTGLDDDQDPLQDPLQDLEASSEKDSDAFSDQPRKGDCLTDGIAGDELDLNLDSPAPARSRHLHLEMIPPPPTSHKASSAPAGMGETITSPLLEPLQDSSDLPAAGTPLSAHHEIQLLREQLEQQCQQTQAAVAQVHLLRDQLTAETTARIEAQARTHQLLVHNKELLDHITALVSHLQDQERTIKPDSSVTVIPQMYGDQQVYLDPPEGDLYLGLDNRNSGGFVTAPSSPKARHSAHTSQTPYFQQPQPMGSMYSLYPTAEQQFQAQLMQRLHPLLSPPVYQTLPPSYNLCTFPTPYYAKRDEAPRRMEEVSPRLDPPPARRKGPDDRRDVREKSREMRDDPRDVREKSRDMRDDPRDVRERSRERRDDPRDIRERSRERRDDPRDVRDMRDDPRDVREKSREIRERSPNASSSPQSIPSPRTPKSPSPASPSLSPPPAVHSPKSSYTNAFASALSTIRTLRVSGGGSSGGDRGGRKTPTSAPGPITRSTSEKVPNRSELMDLVQRTAWARQTK